MCAGSVLDVAAGACIYINMGVCVQPLCSQIREKVLAMRLHLGYR